MAVITNTYILAPEFELIEPETLESALAALARHGSNAQLMAGGTDLLVQMKLERRHPKYVIGLARLRELRAIETNWPKIKFHALREHAGLVFQQRL